MNKQPRKGSTEWYKYMTNEINKELQQIEVIKLHAISFKRARIYKRMMQD